MIILRTMLDKVGIYNFAFEPLPTYPSLVIEFLSTFCLRVQFINEQNPQSVDGEPAWVEGFFDHLSIVEFNFNTRFDQVDIRLDRFEHRMDHMEYDIHQLYAHHNI